MNNKNRAGDEIKIINGSRNLPLLLREIPRPPNRLYYRGDFLSLVSERHEENSPKFLCVVGSRHPTNYGQTACEHLIAGLAGHNIVIVSGLAFGIDSIAHRAALKAGLKTIAVPGSGLDWNENYPKNHFGLAQEIIENDGALVSPFAPQFKAAYYSFPERNRIMAGLSHATLVVEAREKSGTLITSKLATEYNRDVGAVPGSIFSENSFGSHMLIHLGAMPICNTDDLLQLLGIKTENKQLDFLSKNLDEKNLDKNERLIAKILKSPLTLDELVEHSGLSMQEINIALSGLEIMKLVTIRGGIVTPNLP